MNHDMLDSLAETLMQVLVLALPIALPLGAAWGWRISPRDRVVGVIGGAAKVTIALLVVFLAILLSVAFVEGWTWAFQSVFGGAS